MSMELKLRLAGKRQPAGLKPGLYCITCVSTALRQRGNKRQLVLLFRTQDGVELRQWFDVTSETISPLSAYARALEVALGKPLDADSDLNPEQFMGLTFDAEVGFRFEGDPSSVEHKKDVRDFLRVRKLLCRVDTENNLASQAQEIFGGKVVKIAK